MRCPRNRLHTPSSRQERAGEQVDELPEFQYYGTNLCSSLGIKRSFGLNVLRWP